MKTLLPFQQIGALRLAQNYHHILGDVPGLGKTVQAIAAADMLGLKLILVVCPASVRSNWTKEIEECLGSTAGWRIISYNEAHKLAKALEPGGLLWDAIILDEGHFLKTIDSQRTQAIFGNGRDGFPIGLARRAKYKWVLTGTPVLNRPRELFPVLASLHPHFAGVTFATFAQKYCGAYWDGFGINTKGATNVDELSGILDGFMIRRTKKEVFPNRREPDVQLVPLDLTKEDLATVMAEEELILNREAKLSSIHEDFSALGDLARLLRLTGEAKVRATVSYLEDKLQTIDKIVVFFHHTEVGRKLYERAAARGFQPAIYQGGMSDSQKDGQKARFMEQASCRVFLGQIQAAGTGINGLQEVCDRAVFAEQSWVPGAMGQAIDRLDRMNRGGEFLNFVTADILHARGTLESAVLGSRIGKNAVIDRLMNDEERDARGIFDGK